jgi:hypothetical protein
VLNVDYKDIVQNLLHHQVKFLIVGAYAMGAYGYPRATGDFDIWVEPSTANARHVYDAVQAFGTPVTDIHRTTFAEEGVVFQIGVAPRRVDIITTIDGVDFQSAYASKQELDIEDLRLP